jgi:hypothetical protein
MTTTFPQALRFLALAVTLLASGCTPELQCYMQRKFQIDSVYRPRQQQLQIQLLQGRLSRAAFAQRAGALDAEWNRRLEVAWRECHGSGKRKATPKPSKPPATPAPPPVSEDGQDSPRINFYKRKAEEIQPAVTPPSNEAPPSIPKGTEQPAQP